jgi:hypothetical protein
VHTSKKDTEIQKYSYGISEIHEELRATVDVATKNQGNIVAAQLSFEIKIISKQMDLVRTHIVFSLKLPGFECYSHSDLKAKEECFRARLKRFYIQGREVLKIPDNCKHRQYPKFNGDVGDDQLLRHSEQTLALALHEPKNIEMIVQRLIIEIRSKYPNLEYGATIKIYTAVLHIHSNKSSCGPCEHVLLGLQAKKSLSEKYRQFVVNLENELIIHSTACKKHKQNAPFQFSFPKSDYDECGKIRMFTVYSADTPDATHSSHPNMYETKRYDIDPTPIETGVKLNRKHIPLTFFGRCLHDAELNKIKSSSGINTHTIFLSGSEKTSQTVSTKKFVKKKKSQELTDERLGTTFLKGHLWDRLE